MTERYPENLFTYAFVIPAAYWEHHWQSQDVRVAQVAMISGELKVAFGESLDQAGAQGYSVGTFLLVPANVKHTMGADLDTIIFGTAVGPWATHHRRPLSSSPEECRG